MPAGERAERCDLGVSFKISIVQEESFLEGSRERVKGNLNDAGLPTQTLNLLPDLCRRGSDAQASPKLRFTFPMGEGTSLGGNIREGRRGLCAQLTEYFNFHNGC